MLIGRLLLFWSVLGFVFDWRMAHRSASVPWIGTQLTIQQVDGHWGAFAELQPKKVQEVKAAADTLIKAKGMVDIKLVQRLAG